MRSKKMPLERCRRGILSLAILTTACFGMLRAPAPGEPNRSSPRLALLASGGTAAEAVVALAETELSKRHDVALLDRAHIARVLTEQKLALGGMISSADAVRAGSLLSCDVLAVLHCAAGDRKGADDILSLVVFDALTGARMSDATLSPGGDPAAAAADARRLTVAALGKWRGGAQPGDCKTVSIVSMRNVGLPAHLEYLPEAAGTLLKRRLVQSPDIVLLERDWLEHVNIESETVRDRRDRLLLGSRLVDIDLMRGKREGRVGARVILGNPGEQPAAPVVIVVEDSPPESIVGALTAAIASALRATPPARDVAAYAYEADLFAREGFRLRLSLAPTNEIAAVEEAGLALAEAALAMQPAQYDRQLRVCELLNRTAPTRIARQQYAIAVNRVARAVALARKWPYRTTNAGGPKRFDTETGFAYTELLSLAESLRNVESRLDAETRQELDDLFKQFGPWFRDYYIPNNPDFTGYAYLPVARRWVRTADEWVDEMAFCRVMPLNYECGLYTDVEFPISEMLPATRIRLYNHFDQWAQPGDALRTMEPRHQTINLVECHLRAAEMAAQYPDEVRDAHNVLQRHLAAAAQVVDEAPLTCAMYIYTQILNACRLPEALRVSLAEQWARSTKKAGYQTVDLLVWLVEHDPKDKAICKLRLQEAWSQVTDPEARGFVDMLGEKSNCRESCEVRVRETYRKMFGADIAPPFEKKKLPLLDVGQAISLFTLSPQSPARIACAELEGDGVFLLIRDDSTRTYALQSVDLISGRSAEINRITSDWSYDERYWTGGIRIGAKTVLLPTDQGLIIFARDGSWVRTCSTQSGLPADRIGDAIEVNSRIYLGCSTEKAGYIVSCDTNGTDARILASSARKESRSKLDDTAPYRVNGMIHDAPRNQIVFALEFLRIVADPHNSRVHYRFGLWSYRPGDDRFEPLSLSWGEAYRNWEYVTSFGQMYPRLMPDGQCVIREGIKEDNGWNGGLDYWLVDLERRSLNLLVGVHASQYRRDGRFICNSGFPDRVGKFAVIGDHLYACGVEDEGVTVHTPYVDQIDDPGIVVYTEEHREGPIGRIAPLDGLTPIELRAHGNRLIACTKKGLWVIQLRGDHGK